MQWGGLRVSIGVLFALLLLTSCVPSASSQSTPPKWTTGFWFWNFGYVDDALPADPLDVLFVHVGEIRQDAWPLYVRAPGKREERWAVSGILPDRLPPAREYWLVFRFNQQAVPEQAVVPMLADAVANLAGQAKRERLPVKGIQLDIDSPTPSLPQYAKFLASVRSMLPDGYQLSITALLDWFRSGTAIGEVIARTDEFVPQFYDLSQPDGRDAGIAAKIDPQRWGPEFNRFRKPFRIGISSFGRARFVSATQAAANGHFRVVSPNPAPIEIATNPSFRLESSRNAADELVLTYRASRKTNISYQEFGPGDAIQFILATPDTIRAGAASARQMGAFAAGVVFFRWPTESEPLAMQPYDVLKAAGVHSQSPPLAIRTVDGGCAAVKCVDLYLENAHPFAAKSLAYRIRASKPMEYFLPEKTLPIHLHDDSELVLTLPPYCGRGRLLLGRAVTLEAADFHIEQAQ
jgi:Protein of unknown function (DUF3142)